MFNFEICVIIASTGDNMITISEAGNRKLNGINKDDIFVVADFDRTITTGDSKATFALFSLSGLYGSDYERERTVVHDYYRPIELDESLGYIEKYELMKEWALESYKLMLKYKVRESDIETIVKQKRFLNLRSGAVEFINMLNDLGIPLIINSAGIGNFIECILKLNGCYSDNVFISANFLDFKDDIIVDSISDIIHSMNKNIIRLKDEDKYKLYGRPLGILIGDQLSDLNMDHCLPNQYNLTFGFLESNIQENEELFKKNFDVVLQDSESFDTIGKLLRLK